MANTLTSLYTSVRKFSICYLQYVKVKTNPAGIHQSEHQHKTWHTKLSKQRVWQTELKLCLKTTYSYSGIKYLCIWQLLHLHFLHYNEQRPSFTYTYGLVEHCCTFGTIPWIKFTIVVQTYYYYFIGNNRKTRMIKPPDRTSKKIPETRGITPTYIFLFSFIFQVDGSLVHSVNCFIILENLCWLQPESSD